MNKNLILSAALFMIVGIGTLITRQYGWYNTYWFADVILHFLSGMALGLAWMGFEERKRQASLLLILGATSFATFGSVLWEFWEFAGWHITPSHARFYIPELGDTLSDIACGMTGALLVAMSYAILRKIKK